MAKYAARPERPCPPEVTAANRRAERISDVDVSYVVPLKELPALPNGNTSQRTGEQADYAYRASEVTDLSSVREARDIVRDSVREAREESEHPEDELTDDQVESVISALFTTKHPVYDGHELIPEPFSHIARFPLTSMGSGKILTNGSFEFTLKVDDAAIEKVLALYRKRQDGLLFYVDFYALPLADIPEGFRLG